MWICHSWPLDVSSRVKLLVLRMWCYHWEVYLTAYLGTSSHISSLSLCLTSSGGMYIWQPIWVLHLTSYLGHFIWQVAGVYLTEFSTSSANMTCQNELQQQYHIIHKENMSPHGWNFSSNVSSNEKLPFFTTEMSVVLWNCHSSPLHCQ